MPFQTQVNGVQAPAVEGDFASTNPRSTVNAGPGGLVAGPAGATVGRFAWITDLSVDADGAPANANTFGSGPVAGIVHREQQGLLTQFLAEASMFVPQGFPITVFNSGDFWVKNAGSNQVLPGMFAFANYADGRATFAAGTVSGIGSANNGGSASVTGSITAASVTFSGFISGSTLFVTGSVSGTIVVGGTVTGGTGTATGTQIVGQLSGTPGGVGTYALNIPEQSVNNGSNSVIFTESWGSLNVTNVSSGTLGVGDTLTGTGVAVGSTIMALGTGTGGLGTYIVNISQFAASETITAATNIQTKWVATSAGLAGELVKISTWVNG